MDDDALTAAESSWFPIERARLATKVRELEAALAHARAIASAERRARERAEDSARRAWQLAVAVR
jgi:hypothetical protein